MVRLKSNALEINVSICSEILQFFQIRIIFYNWNGFFTVYTVEYNVWNICLILSFYNAKSLTQLRINARFLKHGKDWKMKYFNFLVCHLVNKYYINFILSGGGFGVACTDRVESGEAEWGDELCGGVYPAACWLFGGWLLKLIWLFKALWLKLKLITNIMQVFTKFVLL